MNNPLLVAIAGPTGSGKSELAIRVAAEFDGEVVSCDSVQIYRGFDIGTAKLPEAERHGIPHHLIDVLEPGETFSAGEFARRARAALAGIAGRKRVPVVTGGTGFYLRALLEGLTPGPVRDDSLRERLIYRERKRPGSLHRLLRRLDPDSARKIHPRDTAKITRALEVRLLTGRAASLLFETGKDALQGFRIVKLGLFPERAALYARIDARCERMFAGGLIGEVESLLGRGCSVYAKAFESLGYIQALQALKGELTPQQALEQTKQATRRYAKRQMTWFRREDQLLRFEGFGDEPAIQRAVSDLLKSALID
ncbi:MAG: tRNA (adenosine(37)-N6)-dimethylallyltransferase MiaA [Acidobacteriota bacterium]|nr:tRNA (adenosine(37)-N6)-dimethylallyltransferase MiaA [Acidobacteriota bacterium]